MVDFSKYSDKELAAIAGESPQESGDALGVLARTGRAAAGGLAGMAGIVADPLTYGLSAAEEAITGREIQNKPLRQSVLEGYDEMTGGAGLPRNQLERVVQSGGEALTGGGLFAKTPAAMKTATDLVSQIGSGAAAQWAAENSDNPLAPIAAGIVGAVAPQAIASLPKAATKLTAKSLGVNPEKVAQLEQAGLPVNVPAASTSPMIKRAANQMAELPGGKVLQKSMDTAFKDADDAIKQLGYTGTTKPVDAGTTINKAFTRWKDDSLKAFKNVDEQLKQVVPDDASVDVVAALESSAKDIIYKKGLTPRQMEDRLSDPAVIELGALIGDAAAKGGRIPIAALKEARTKLGGMSKFDPLTPSKNTAIAERSYGALSKILEDAADQVGGKAAKELFQKRNKLYARFADENKNYVAKLQKKLGDNPESIWSNLTSGNKLGASNAKRTLAKLNADEIDTVRDALIYQNGGADNFQVGKWANSYRSMSDDAKSAFFIGKPDLKKAHDALVVGLDNYQDVGRFANFSGTTPAAINPLVKVAAGGGAGAATLFGLITGTVSLPAVLGTAVGAYGINRAMSGMLASPKYTKLLAKALTESSKNPQKYNKAIARALTANGASEVDVEALMQATPAQQPAPSISSLSDAELQSIIDSENITVPAQPVGTGLGEQATMQNEGLELTSYKDTENKTTVGRGFNMQSGIARKVWKKAGIDKDFAQVFKGNQSISLADADRLFNASREIAVDDALKVYPRLSSMSESQQTALLDMSYQLGLPNLKAFKEFNTAVNKGDMSRAVTLLRQSKMATQTPERVKRTANLLLTGV